MFDKSHHLSRYYLIDKFTFIVIQSTFDHFYLHEYKRGSKRWTLEVKSLNGQKRIHNDSCSNIFSYEKEMDNT